MTAVFINSLPVFIYVLLAIVLSAVLIVVSALCACHEVKDGKNQDYGIPGRLSSITVDEPTSNRCSSTPVTLENGTDSNLRSLGDVDENGEMKFRTVVERALPDIPNGHVSGDTDTDQTPDSGSECYATVTNKLPFLERNGKALPLSSIVNKQNGISDLIKAPASSSEKSHSDSGALDLLGNSSALPSTTHKYAHVQKPHHPYARLSNQVDSDPGTDEYDESQSSDRDKEKRSAYALADFTRSSSKPTFENDMSSPSSSSIGPSSDEAKPNPSIAGQAVAGNIPSAEIPYMTPPISEPSSSGHNLPPHFVENVNQREVPYTVISVREPLERVRMQTQKLRKRQQSNQGSSLDEPEGYYMEVPDDEQTYAEIESGPNSGESSTTYDHIEPRNPDFPPDPPTVESLKSVAQAHSRQASIASMSSFGSAGEGQSSTKDVSALYSVVDKGGKKSHTVPESPNFNKREVHNSNVDELYAKVQKKRAGGTMSVSGIEDVLRTDKVGSDDVFGAVNVQEVPPALPPVSGRLHASSLFEPSTSKTLARRHSAEPGYSTKNLVDKEEPGYASVNMEMLKNNCMKFDKANTDSDDPGYERIRRETELEEPGYEFIRNNGHFFKDGSDPGYETVSHLHSARYVSRNDSDKGSADPGYERVLRVRKPEVEGGSDPEYEYVKYLSRADSDVDPGYEGIRVPLSRKDSEADPGYEVVKRKLRRQDSELAEPGYEKVKSGFRRNKSNKSVDPGYEKVKSSTNINRSESELTDPRYEKVGFNHIKNSYVGEEKITVPTDSKIQPIESITDLTNVNGELAEGLQFWNKDNFCDTEINTTNEVALENANYRPQSDNSGFLGDGSQQSSSTSLISHPGDSGIIVSGERISIRINCSTTSSAAAPLNLPKIEPLEVLSVSNNATNLMLGGSPSIHTFSNESSVSVTENLLLEDCLIEVQSNQDYETASSGGSTLSSRYSTTNRRSTNSISFVSTIERDDTSNQITNTDKSTGIINVEYIKNKSSSNDVLDK